MSLDPMPTNEYYLGKIFEEQSYVVSIKTMTKFAHYRAKKLNLQVVPNALG